MCTCTFCVFKYVFYIIHVHVRYIVHVHVRVNVYTCKCTDVQCTYSNIYMLGSLFPSRPRGPGIKQDRRLFKGGGFY